MVNITAVSHMTPLNVKDPFRATKALIMMLGLLIPCVCAIRAYFKG